jgi:hypothetical protein
MFKKSVLLSPAALLIYGAAIYALFFDRSLWYLPIVFLGFTLIWLAILKFFHLDP